MPPAVVNRLNEALNEISAMPDVVDRMRKTLFIEPATSTPAVFHTLVEKELVKWREIGKTLKVGD